MKIPHCFESALAALATAFIFTVANPAHAGTLLASDGNLPNGNLGTVSATVPSSVVISSAQGVAYEPAGTIVVSYYGGALKRYSATGVYVSDIAANSAGNGGLAVDVSGNIFLSRGASIYKYTSTGTLLGTFATASAPQGLTFDAAGNLYAADSSAGTVLKFSPGGTLLQTFAGGLNAPFGVAVQPNGHVLVGNFSGSTVTEFDSDGTNLGNFASGLSSAAGLAIDDSGNVFVADRGNFQVKQFSSTGTLLGTFPTGSSQPTYLAAPFSGATPVPEPSAALMLVTGLTSLIGYRRVRRTLP